MTSLHIKKRYLSRVDVFTAQQMKAMQQNIKVALFFLLSMKLHGPKERTTGIGKS